MSPNARTTPKRFRFGTYREVVLEVPVWDAAGAEVDLSCACMFAHEVGPGPTGGLRHLDQVVGGALLRLRAEAIFRGEVSETLLLSRVPAIPAKALMMIGLGEPEAFHAQLMNRAARCAISAANARGAASAGIAPGLLDSGLPAEITQEASGMMLSGVIEAIDAAHRLAEFGFAPLPTLKSWSFGAGATHAEGLAADFCAQLAAITNAHRPGDKDTVV